jgi:hypothetical protein
MVGMLRVNLARAVRLLLMLIAAGLFTGCPRSDSGDQPPAAPDGSRLSLGVLVATVAAGDGAVLVRDWIAWRRPHGEAYSFLEYADDYGVGRAYYWGDWQTRRQPFCAVRMQKDYTPVQIDFTLGWFEELTGNTPEDLRQEFMSLHAEHQGDAQPNLRQTGERVGEILTYATPTAVVRLFADDSRAVEHWVLAMMLPAEQVARVVARNDPHPELNEFGTENQPATLDAMIELLRGSGARGMLQQFDFTAFKRSKWHTPLDGSDLRDYTQATIYLRSSLAWDDPGTCYLSAFDGGARAELLFAAAWYETFAGYSADELAIEFEALHAQHGGTTIRLDAANDAYDMDFAYVDLDGVTVVRRRYLKPPHPGHAHYILWAGPPLFADAPTSFPAWDADELPPLRDKAGSFEQFIHAVATTPVPQLRAQRLYGFIFEEWPRRLHQVSPFTMLNVLRSTETVTQRQLCHVELLDETWLELLEFRPDWFCQQTGASQGDLESEFAALRSLYGAADTTDRAGTGEGGQQPRAAGFGYGPLTIRHLPGPSPDGSEDWYRIELPTWP